MPEVKPISGEVNAYSWEVDHFIILLFYYFIKNERGTTEARQNLVTTPIKCINISDHQIIAVTMQVTATARSLYNNCSDYASHRNGTQPLY
jgi:hypothetical protein